MTSRDLAITEFVRKMKVVSFSTLRQIFFSNVSLTIAYRVLGRLTEYGELEREKHYFVNEHIFWIPKRKPKQLKHALLLSEFYRRLSVEAEIVKFDVEYTTFRGLRPDAFIAYKRKDGKNFIAFVEVELSNNKFNLQKYVDLFESGEWQKVLPVFPLLIVVGNEKVRSEKLKVVQVREDFSDFSI